MPPAVRDALEKLGTSRDRNPASFDLHDILISLSELPPERAAQAGREIASAAQLWPYQQVRSWIGGVRSRPRPDLEILEKDANSAWLFLFHHSGFMRESALNAIRLPPISPFFLSAIILRLNDWVEPVRVAATKCAMRVFPSVGPATAADTALAFLRHHWTWGRWQEDEHAVLDGLFGRADVITVLADRLTGGTAGALATCLRHALQYPAIDEHLSLLASNATQPAVRATALQCLISRKASWPVGYQYQWIDKIYGVQKRVPVARDREISVQTPVEQLIRNGIADGSPMVRRVAVDALIANRQTFPGIDLIVASLLRDRSPSIRERADFLVRHRTD